MSKFRSFVVVLILQVMGAGALRAAPANDAFSAAQTITTTTSGNGIPGTTVDATAEPEEPVYVNSGMTVWYKWIAPSSGWMRASTTSSSTTISNIPRVVIMEGTTLENLAIVSNDVPGSSLTRFNAFAGKTYYLHVTENDTPGPFTLTLTATTAPAPPPNDNFGGAITLAAALPRVITGTFVDASVELREPEGYVESGRSTVWYRWIPAASGWVTMYVDTNATAGLNLYTGSALTSLTGIQPRYLNAAYPEAFYEVTSGTTYFIQLLQESSASRTFTLNIESIPVPAPSANNNFASRLSLGNAASVNLPEQDNTEATIEPSEPRPLSNLTSTLWYTWTAPTTGPVEFKTVGSPDHDTFLAVYTGNSLATLSPVGFDDDIDVDAGDYDSSLVLPVTAGTVYQIQVGSAYAAWDTFTLSLAPSDADLQPFRVTAFSASASTVNLTSAPATVTFDVTLSDSISDPSLMSLNLSAPTSLAPWGAYPARRYLEDPAAPVLVNGLTYRFTRTLPAGLPAGAYVIILDISGQASGFANDFPAYGGPDGVQLPGNLTSLTVTNTGTILTPPALTNFTISPASVDVTNASATVTLTAQATGLSTDRLVEVLLTNPLGVDAVFNEFFLLHNGTQWTTTLTIPKGTPPGTFRPTVILYGDTLGRNYGYADALASTLPAGSPTVFTVTNSNPDRLPPQVRAFTMDAASLSLYAGDVILSGTVRITDVSQTNSLDIGFDDGFSTTYPFVRQSLISGNAQDGLYRWSFLVPASTTPSGGYSLTVLTNDGAGNSVEFATFYTTWPAGLTPPTVSLTNGQQESAEILWMATQDFSGLPAGDQVFATAITADPDRDGIPNLLEFHFGTNPASPNHGSAAGNLPVVSRTGNVLLLGFGKSAANAALGVPGSSLTAEFSTDLLEWTDQSITATMPGFFRADSPPLTLGKGYLRLSAQPLP